MVIEIVGVDVNLFRKKICRMRKEGLKFEGYNYLAGVLRKRY